MQALRLTVQNPDDFPNISELFSDADDQLFSRISHNVRGLHMFLSHFYLHRLNILADRTNGRAYATVLRLSVCRLWCYVLWLNGTS